MYLICKLQEIELSHVVLLFLNIFVIVSNLTVNMGIVDVSDTHFISLGCGYQAEGFLEHMLVLILILWRNTILFSIMVEPNSIPTNSTEVFIFSRLCQHLFYSRHMPLL